MKRIKVPFTPEQQSALAANPYTLSITEYQIRFTVSFKEFLLRERAAHGTPWKEIFRKAGYDPDVLGKGRLDKIIRNIRKEATSERGLHETAAKNHFADKELEKQQLRTAVRDLQKEVVRLEQMVEFLKKTQQLRMQENKGS